jgi:hypothetical protein
MQDMSPNEMFRQLKQQVEICDDCDKPPAQGCINTWFPSWYLQTEDDPEHPASVRGKLVVARHAKRCPQFNNKPVEQMNKRIRRGFVFVGKKK